MITIKWVIVSLLLILAGCSELDNFILPDGQNTYNSDGGKMITLTEANEIIRDYLKKQHIPWGDPTNVRSAPNRFIFNFDTPKYELRNRGPRRLVVNVHTGEVGLPITSGGSFSDIQAPAEGQRFMGESRN
jgi:hypothetical protein